MYGSTSRPTCSPIVRLIKARTAPDPGRESAGEGSLKLSLTRRYRFSASHRLHSANFSEEENRRLYGKCNNPYGHGHNYVVEVTITGLVDPSTGMIANLEDLDRFVEREVVEAFDCKYLNEELPEFRDHRANDGKRCPRDLWPA